MKELRWLLCVRPALGQVTSPSLVSFICKTEVVADSYVE